MRVVVDTNVVVSALLSPYGPPAEVLRLLLQGDLQALYDDRILAEYREVLSRQRFGFAAEDVRMLLEGIEGGGETVFAKPLALELPDPDDLPFLEVAVAGRADALVTGNARHYRPARGKHGVEIVSPKTIVERLAHS